jgi:hypothetical protein
VDRSLIRRSPADDIRSFVLSLLGRPTLSASVCWVPPKTDQLDLSSVKSGCAGIAAAYESSTSASIANCPCIQSSQSNYTVYTEYSGAHWFSATA